MSFSSVKPPPPPPPDLWDHWIRDARLRGLETLTWRAQQGELGRWFDGDAATQLVASQNDSGQLDVVLMASEQPDRGEILVPELVAQIASDGSLSPEPSTTIDYRGVSYVLRLDGGQLIAVAI